MDRYDVLVAGCGPVGAVLAARLAAHGLTALVVEREPAPFALPRAVAVDDEVQLLLARTAPGLVEPMQTAPAVRFLDARHRPLGSVAFPAAHGFAGLAFFHQPTLEAALRAHLAGRVEVRLGTSLERFAQRSSSVEAALSDGSSVSAGWLVGCDGASSVVRRDAGIAWLGRDLPQPWLVADVAGMVPERQQFTYTCDPARPQVDLPVPGGHRWEWLLRGGHRGGSGALGGGLSDVATTLLRRDTRAEVEVVRAVVYRFGARRAATWQAGRVLLAGDAAHTMPPFAGQGLGAGLRDAWALASLLARGDVSPYQPLRSPHVRQMTRLSLLLGAALQARHGSAARDALLRGAFQTPRLGGWLASGGPRRSDSGVLDLP